MTTFTEVLPFSSLEGLNKSITLEQNSSMLFRICRALFSSLLATQFSVKPWAFLLLQIHVAFLMLLSTQI